MPLVGISWPLESSVCISFLTGWWCFGLESRWSLPFTLTIPQCFRKVATALVITEAQLCSYICFLCSRVSLLICCQMGWQHWVKFWNWQANEGNKSHTLKNSAHIGTVSPIISAWVPERSQFSRWPSEDTHTLPHLDLMCFIKPDTLCSHRIWNFLFIHLKYHELAP